MIIAVDGPAASGKGTLARRLAKHFNLRYLDTGALYRAVARDMLRTGKDLRNVAEAAQTAKALDPESLDNAQSLRAPGVGEAASIVAKIPEVRAALLAYQRQFAQSPEGAVLDGRDIGTIVCPDAKVKIFITASAQERAKRRYLELVNQGEDVTEPQVLDQIRARDARDSDRTASPLVQAQDAHLLNTTNLDIEESFKAALDLIMAQIG